jgi:hypothetical protein
MAKQTHIRDDLPPGHVPLPVVLTGSMGLALAAGLQVLGLLENLDLHLAGFVSDDVESLSPAISDPVLWTATAAVAYALALVVLEIPGTWRRVVVWISTMLVIAAWLPVAAIGNAHVPVAAPLVAAAWAGLCTIIYAARHHMEADDLIESPCPAPQEETPESESPDATD